MKKLATYALVSVLMLFSRASFAAPQVIDIEMKDASRDRTIPLKVRLPEGEAKAPLVVFSHGLGGSVEGGKSWGERWASSGYLVVHVQHPGSDIVALRDSNTQAPTEPAQRVRNIATPDNLIGRVDDVRFLISEIERQQRGGTNSWANRVDLSRIAMTGHSFGAHTTMALAGQRYPGPVKTLSDPRIKAFIALSPNATGLERTFDDRFGAMNVPFLSITGTLDGDPLGPQRNVKKAVERRIAVYEHQPAGDKFLYVINGADHMVFNGNEAQRIPSLSAPEPMSDAEKNRIFDAVNQTSTRFLDAYLRDDAKAKSWLKDGAGKALLGSGEWRAK